MALNVKITATSREFSAKERIAIKDTSDALKLDTVVTLEKPLIITPKDYAMLEIHNPNPKNASDSDYANLVIITEDGTKYATGSNSFIEKFMDIYDEMAEETEPYQVKIFKSPSKNYNGNFITCSIVM